MQGESLTHGETRQPLEPGPRSAGAPSRGIPANLALLAEGVLAYLDRSAAGILILESGSLAVRYANPAVERLSPRPPGANAAPRLADVLPPAAVDAVLGLTEAMPSGLTGPCEADIASGRAGPGVVDWRVAVSRTPGRGAAPPDLVLEIRDVTRERQERYERDRLLEELREVNSRLLDASLRETDLAERANAASAAKSTFLATMSHELRTPLTAIIGYEELLFDGLFGPLSDIQKRHLGRIGVSAKHLLALIDQVLMLARVEAGEEVIVLEEVVVADLMRWTATIIEPLAYAKGLAFSAGASADSRATPGLRTDGTKVRQILVNLLGNAVKFTEMGEVALLVRQQEERVDFVIRDSGVGISPADIERVFETFWQVEQRPTRVAGGSGLGLSVSRRLARLLGGDITVDSTPGVGSTFVVSLPIEAPVPARR